MAWSIVIILASVSVVEVYARSLGEFSLDLVPVSQMAPDAARLLLDKDFLVGDLLWTAAAIVVSFCLAVVIGTTIGYLMWRSRWWDAALQPYVSVFYSVPLFAVYPILVVLFGTGFLPIIVLSTSFSAVVVISHSVVGFNSVSTTVTKMAMSLRLTKAAYLRKILIPAALPDILSGLKLALAYAVIAVLATEFILSTRGLGHHISFAYNSLDTRGMYAGVLVAIAFTLAVNLGMDRLFDQLNWKKR